MSQVDAALAEVVREVETHAARSGWDQPAQLFALVDTGDLIQREPHLAELLGIDAASATAGGGLTPVEQETVADTLEELLPTIVWPPEVSGCAVVVEALTVDSEEARIVAGALRSGASYCAIRQRNHDEDDLVLTGPDLVPGLLQLLQATLEPETRPEQAPEKMSADE